MKEYKIAKGWAIFIYVTTPFIFALFSWILFLSLVSESVEIEALYLLAPFSLGMMFLIVVAILDAIKGKVTVSLDTISIKSTLINRTLSFHEVKGFRIDNNYLFIESNTKLKKRIKIALYIENPNDLIEWVKTNFIDLDSVQEIQEEAEILVDIEFGQNIEARTHKLKLAKRVALVLNASGLVLLIWILILPKPYEYVVVLSILLPLISTIAILYFKGLIRIDFKKGSAYPYVFFAIFFPSIGLLVRAIFDYSIYDYSNIWKLSILIGILMTIFAITGTREFRFKDLANYFTVFSIALIFWAYGYGSIVILNCMYDKNEPMRFEVKVLDKNINENDYGDTYNLTIAPWNTQIDKSKIEVPEPFYDAISIDDSIEINLKEGWLGASWFYPSNKIIETK